MTLAKHLGVSFQYNTLLRFATNYGRDVNDEHQSS